MSYLDRLKEHISETPPVSEPSKPPKLGSVGFDGNPRGRISENDARAILREWHGHLSGLDFNTAPDGLTLKRWRQLVDDAGYIYEGFGSQLVREGWDALDIFGVGLWRPDGVVLLDRLQGARNLLLDGEGRAFWSSFSVTFQTCRGIGKGLIGSGLRLVWEIPNASATA